MVNKTAKRKTQKTLNVFSDPHYRYAIVGKQLLGCKNVLDVGGYEDCGPWLKKTAKQIENYTSLNISAAWYGPRKFHDQYDGKQIPFDEKTFDAVVFVDSLEHIPNNLRISLVRQALKIARKKVVLLFPFGSDENIQFEKSYRDFLRYHDLPIKPSIKEHYRFGLPNEMTFIGVFKKHHPQLQYVSDRRIFGNYTFAQIIVAAAYPEESYELNMGLQKIMEDRLMNEGKTPKHMAHRALIVINK